MFPGTRIGKDDPRYPTMVRGFNLRFAGNPDYVQVCGDTDQVVRTVQEAFDAGERITVRCGGHCYEDFVCDNDGGVIIDLSPMDGVSRADDGTYCVEGGNTLWNVYTRLYREYGVTIPGGSCYSVGAGGHVTGGGYGLLSRLHGLTVDRVTAMEVVHVDSAGKAQAIVVGRESKGDEYELFWGYLGGGGGNFGIVTKFWFDAPAAPSDAWIFSHAWNWSDLAAKPDDFAGLVNRYATFLAENSAPDSPFAGLFSLLHLYQNAGPKSQITLTTQYVGDTPRLLEDFAQEMGRGLPAPTVSAVPGGYGVPALGDTDIRQMPWLYATQQVSGVGMNQRGKYKSAYMIQPFPEHQVDAMWRNLVAPQHPNALALVQIDSYGCRVNAVDSEATAIPQRSSIMKLQYQTYWPYAGGDEQNLHWIKSFYDDMYGPRGPYPDGTVDGCYVNYPDVDLEDWQYLYYKDLYPRLQRVKSRWDPHDVFRHKQSIEPAA